MSIAASAAFLLAVQAAPSEPATTVDPARLISSFGSVCLEHLGDPRAQIAAARAAPWNFAPDEETADHVTRFRSEMGMLGVWEAGKVCTMTVALEPGVDLRAFQAAMSASLPMGEGSPLEPSHSVYWLIAPDGSDEQFVMSLKVSDQTGRNLATLWVQSRESLH
jgi:hypothetical protein